VRRPRHIAHFAIVTGPLVLVVDHQSDRCAERLSIFNAGKNGYPIGFVARGGHIALTGAAACQLRLDVGFAQLQVGRATIHDRSHGLAVRLAKC